MAQLVKKLQNNRSVLFDKGKFDDWCVYLVESNGVKKAPFDQTYFHELYTLSLHYPMNKVYDDFILIYDQTTKSIELSVVSLIDEIVKTYSIEHQVLVEQWMTVLYAGMIAEENKQFAILKKRVKRLGMYQVFALQMPAMEAAKFSTNKNWKDLDEIMKGYGF
jgi:transcription initiation factor IIF auxiliary subunit